MAEPIRVLKSNYRQIGSLVGNEFARLRGVNSCKVLMIRHCCFLVREVTLNERLRMEGARNLCSVDVWDCLVGDGDTMLRSGQVGSNFFFRLSQYRF